MQELHRKHGTIRIIRRWDKIGGLTICLDENGDYIYLDGKPVRDRNFIDEVMPENSHDKRLCVAWWEENWGKSAKAEQKRQVEEQAKDEALYTRKRGKYRESGPKTWQQLGFTERPGWYGEVDLVVIKDTTYKRVYSDKKE